MERLGVAFAPIHVVAAVDAGETWRRYLRTGGTRERIVADFLVASHAATSADRLLTRDRGFYRSQFSGLTVVDPSAGSA